MMLLCLAVVLQLVLLGLTGCNSNFIEGNAQNCTNEGGRVFPRAITNIHCFACMCKNGQVECLRNKCPSEEGCFMLQNEMVDSDGCCRKCKGCYYQGAFYDSDTEWPDPNDPCMVIACKAGVVTETKLQCYTPCSNPIAPAKGQCCPTCQGCRMNGRIFSASRTVSLMDDPCLKCTCDTSGWMTCSKKACPVLQCPPANIEWKPGQCCPVCSGSRKLFNPSKGSCLLGMELQESGKTVRQDRCTYCSCINSTSVCRRETCPPLLNCPFEKQQTSLSSEHGICCPQCSSLPAATSSYVNSTSCLFSDRVYKDGETWKANECKSCICRQGEIHCAVEICSLSSNTHCPANMKLHKDPSACCPRCVEGDGVCSVFGDPHYRTFDGRFYSFQGACKYQLTADCLGQTFSIRVTNDARATKTSSWTKTVAFRMGKVKVNMGEKMRVKINGERVLVPFKKENLLSIVRTSDSLLMLQTHLGVKLIWDGNSFLEVTVPTIYKGRLCGLCGNYNSMAGDDLMSRDGRLQYDTDLFGKSWQVGGRKACNRPETQHRRPTAVSSAGSMRLPCSIFAHRKSKDKLCKSIRSELFSACHEKLNPDIYFKSCLMDMCECPDKKCYCESATAYAHECQRLGILLADQWRSTLGCSVNQ